MNSPKHLRAIKSLALLAAFAVSATLAHATTITYNLTNVTTSAGALTGTVAIDTTTDKVTAANITFHDTVAGNPVFTNIGSPSVNGYNGIGIDYISGASGQLALYYSTANIGTGNLSICISGGACGSPSSPQTSYAQIYVSPYQSYNVTGGMLDPALAAAAPEPSSLVLFGTGILGLAGVARRRLLKA